MGVRGTTRAFLSALAVIASLALVACGDDDGEDTTSTVTETETISEPAEETGGAATTEAETPSSSGETADLPTCDQGVYPCRNPDGSVSTEPPADSGGGGIGGETADLPECGAAPPPCRQGNTVIEP